MHLVIVSAFKYPNGGPAAARHLALASGLLEEGHQVSVVLLNQADWMHLAGLVDGINWVSIAEEGSSAIKWRQRAVLELGPALDAINRAESVGAVLLTGLDPILLQAGVHAARRRGFPVFHELTEYPDVVTSSSLLGRLGRTYFERKLIRSFDGMFVISSALKSFVQKRSASHTKILGAIVDLAQHKPFPPLALGSHLAVGYAGSLSEAKDGVLTLLAAVAKAKPKLAPKLVLQVHILGDVQSSHGQLAVERVRDLGIEEEVTFHGLVPHLDVKNYLHKCHLLVLPRPDSRQARGGFPTKLGEYLSSARPVMTTSVGDIPQFLTDQENCLMVTPGDEDLMASTLVYVTENYELAVKIGRRGREVVERLFDARLQAREAVNFLNGLSDNG